MCTYKRMYEHKCLHLHTHVDRFLESGSILVVTYVYTYIHIDGYICVHIHECMHT
jgi:hypothetical protein